MRIRLWRRPSPALVISLIALFVALGGTTYAAVNLPANSVGTQQLKKNAVTAAKIKTGAVTAAKINGALPTAPTNVADNPKTSTDPCTQATPQTGVFCGRSSAFWGPGEYAATHLQFWRDVLGVVHIAGEARLSTTFSPTNGSELFVLPPAYRPKTIEVFPVATGSGSGAFSAGSGFLVIVPGNFSDASLRGLVELSSASVTGQEVFIGDVQFRTN